MFVSRLSFSTIPGKGHEAAGQLMSLAKTIESVTGTRPRVVRTHFASLGEADFQLEQEVPTLAELETELRAVTANDDFRRWSEGFSKLLLRSPQREILEIVE